MRSDLELLNAWRAGDVAAGEELFGRYFESLFRFFRNKVDTETEDLLQRTFLAVVRSADRFRGDASFRTYLFTIARNELHAFFRARQRQPGQADVAISAVRDLGTSPSQALARQDGERQLLDALRRIPLDQQTILELYYWEKMTAPELAEILELPIPAVRSRIRRAKESLQHELLQLEQPLSEIRAGAGLERWVQSVRSVVSPSGSMSVAAGAPASPNRSQRS